jgi:hypothetical protein
MNFMLTFFSYAEDIIPEYKIAFSAIQRRSLYYSFIFTP